MTIKATETAKISADTALISGVMPRRRRPQISSGKVLSLPVRKKVTAISSIDSGKNQRQKHQPAKESLSGKAGAVERQRRKQSQGQGERHAAGGDLQAVRDSIPEGGIGEKLAVPSQREMAGRETADAVTIEGIKNENDDRQIDKDENERGVNEEQRTAAASTVAAHW